MIPKTIRTSLAAALMAAVCFIALPHSRAGAQTPAQAPLRVFASNAVRTLLDDLGPQCEKAAGRPLDIHYGTSASIKKDLSSGQSFDVTVGTADLIDALIKEGKISPASRADIARSSVGVGYRSGAPKPDVATADGMKRALLSAKAIALTEGGASVPFVMNMAAKLGIADQVKAKAVYGPTTSVVAQDVIDGKADLLFTMVSEILPIKGVKLAGPIPAQFDRYLNFSAGASASSANAKSAEALIHYLDSPSAAPALKAKGLERAKS